MVLLQGKWCVASPWASDDQLQANIDFACGKVDCSIVKSGGACFDPNTVKNRASVAMNLYYQQTGEADMSCDFNGTGNIVTNDPSKCFHSKNHSIFIVQVRQCVVDHDLDMHVWVCFYRLWWLQIQDQVTGSCFTIYDVARSMIHICIGKTTDVVSWTSVVKLTWKIIKLIDEGIKT